MTTVSRIYKRISVYNRNFKEYTEQRDNFLKIQDPSGYDMEPVFDKIKFLYVMYNRVLRDYYKEQGIYLFLPSEILKKAQEDGLIDNASVWLEYIDLLNELLQTQDKKLAKVLYRNILTKYLYEPDKSHKLIQKWFKQEIWDEYMESPKVGFPDNKPLYTAQEIGLSEKSYNIFLNFCKSHKELKKMWLHGSRYNGTARKATDIDCIVDLENGYPAEDFKTLINQLPIPNRFDIASTQDESEFMETVTKTPIKCIYRQSDLNKSIILYKDYYQNSYKPLFEDFIYFIKHNANKLDISTSKKILFKKILELYKHATNLISYYMGYQGLFYYKRLEVIQEACRCELIQDGDSWIKLYKLYKTRRTNFRAYLQISQSEIDEYTRIYTKLYDFFGGMDNHGTD